ncbi:RNA-directed DNA polymerase [Deltaproteobacteria bacterium]|nr:RNA-directed DNA polymerase [Deltaproteobacteria bacterium]
MRDVVDFFEYDLDPEQWIGELLDQIAEGRYRPQQPRHFSKAKSGGFSRRMTMPAIPDLVLYRTIVDYLYARGRTREVKHAYCEASELPSLTHRPAGSPDPWRRIHEMALDYESSSTRSFRAWLHYEQYRKRLMLKRVYRYVVTADIANYFDSILFERVADALHSVKAPPRMIGLLFLILEALSPRDVYAESSRLGLPVDEFACSRKLAHLVLFPHDETMVRVVGEEAYVRWMDDQNFGAETRGEGLAILGEVDRSLRTLSLNPNAKKSKVMKVAEARRHFHLDINEALDLTEQMPTASPSDRRALRAHLSAVWARGKQHDGKGEWDKILKRCYRLLARAQSRQFRRRAVADVLRAPALVERVGDYMRCTGSVSEYLDYVYGLSSHPEQVYPDVSRALFESLLRLEPTTASDARRIREVASSALKNPAKGVFAFASDVAPLLILRFGDRRSLPVLRTAFTGAGTNATQSAARASAIVFAGYGPSEAAVMKRAAGRLLYNHLARLVRTLDAIRTYRDVPDGFKNRIRSVYDPVAGRKYIDMRGLVAVRLLGLNRSREVQQWLRHKRATLEKTGSEYETALLARIWPG